MGETKTVIVIRALSCLGSKAKKSKECLYFKGEKCELLDQECFRKNNDPKNCGFYGSYSVLQEDQDDLPITARLKKEVLNNMVEKWKPENRGGDRQMTAKALEDGVKKILKEELQQLNVEVTKRKSYPIAEDTEDKVKTIIDCMIKKEGKPTTLISVKTFLKAEPLRESLAVAYLIKKYAQPDEKINFYIVALNSLEPLKSKSMNLGWLKLSKPEINGVYSLSSEPYFDGLVKELKGIYQILDH